MSIIEGKSFLAQAGHSAVDRGFLNPLFLNLLFRMTATAPNQQPIFSADQRKP
jgi:hypothetical protein